LRIAVKIVDRQILAFDETGRLLCRQDIKIRVLVMTRADMAEPVHNVLRIEDVVRGNEIVEQSLIDRRRGWSHQRRAFP